MEINVLRLVCEGDEYAEMAEKLEQGRAYTERELGQALLSATGARALQAAPPDSRDALRADIFKQILIHSV